MGNLKYILLVCMMFIITSCEGLFYTDNVGNPIRFGASPGNKGTITRTIYSGTVDGTTERIYWSGDGDDKVSIYMDWDENRDGTGYTGKPENGIYSVNPGSDFHPGDLRYGRISYANEGEALKWHGDFKDNNGRANEYPHTFWSAYPPTDLINGMFTFDLPSNQNGSMKYAYMAAYEKDVKSNTNSEGHVELHYYPMITTFCLTIHNDLDERIEKIALKSDSDSKKLAGKYSVSVNNGSFGFYDYEGNNSGQVIRNVNIGSGGTVKDLLFFIIPQDFNANELYFSLNSNDKEYRLPKYIEAYHKYNIDITVSKKEPDIEEPEVVPPVIDDALAQLIFAVVRTFEEEKFLELFKDFIDEHYYKDKPNYDLDFWHDFLGVFRTETEGAYDRLTSFLGDNLNDFLDVLGNIEELDVSAGYDITSKKLILGKEFGKIFKNVKRVYAQINDDITFELDGLNSLESFEITGGSNGHIDLTIKDCPNFTDFTISADGVHPDNISLVRTPKFESGYVSNSNLNNSSIYLEDCSTGVQSAHIRFTNQNLRPTVKREGNTKNVIVECGYYDMVQWWPPIYGDWHTTWTNSI